MKEIILAKGRGIALVDDEDFEILNQYKWSLLFQNKGPGYAIRNATNKERQLAYPANIRMHRQILDVLLFDNTIQVDHKNLNTLDNQKSNLRLCNNLENSFNKVKQRGSYTSIYKGVSFDEWSGKYVAKIYYKGKSINLGRYNTPEEAAIAYNNEARELFKEFAVLNTLKAVI